MDSRCSVVVLVRLQIYEVSVVSAKFFLQIPRFFMQMCTSGLQMGGEKLTDVVRKSCDFLGINFALMGCRQRWDEEDDMV